MLGANALVRDNVRVLLGSMGYQYLVAPILKEALTLLEQGRPDAAILDPQQADSPPARVVAAFHKMVPYLRGRTIVLLGEESDPDLLQPSVAGARPSHSAVRRLLYESDRLVADLSVEGHKDSQRVTLVGQVLDTAKPEPHLSSVPIVLQGHEGLMGMAKTNEWGEFRFEFNFEPGVSLEIGTRQNYWVSVGLPDSKSVTGGTTEETKAPADSEAQKDVHPKGKKRGRRDGKP